MDSMQVDWTTQRKRFGETLFDDVLPFWFPRCIDEVHGGYFSALDRDGSLIDTDKSVWAQGRMSWMLLTLYNSVEQRPEWLDWGEQGLRFIDEHCYDTDGRLFFHVSQDGRPIRKRRYAFSESFAAIAYAAHFKATGDISSAEKARLLFDRFTRWHFTPGLIPPKYLETRPMIGLGPYMIAMVTSQELRSNLGENLVFESWIDRCLNDIVTLFVKRDEKVVMETVGPHGEILDHFDGRLLNPGHAIEAAWFVMEEGRYRRDQKLIELGIEMLDWMWERGWDAECGGLYYFRDLRGKPVQEYWHDMKFWWPHNEAMIACLMAHQLSGDEKWRLRFNLVCDWSFSHFPDQEHGGWYGYLRRDGAISVPLKGNLWKSFFHLPRSLLKCWSLLDD
jgi:N-acylglucosamine 2-epimerase